MGDMYTSNAVFTSALNMIRANMTVSMKCDCNFNLKFHTWFNL